MVIFGESNDAPEARKVVRMYSEDIKGRLPLGSHCQAVGKIIAHGQPNLADVRHPWRRFYAPTADELNRDPISETINTESKKLLEKWAPFFHSCRDGDRLDLGRSEPTMEGVIELVQRAMTTAQNSRENSRKGKAMKHLHRFCRAADSHKAIVSIFAGTLNVVLQASVNHERIIESLAEALCTISDAVVECRTELDMFRSREMMQLITDFYAHIFVFLSDVMDWIAQKSRKRLLDSFNENFSKKFQDQVDMIKRKADKIQTFAAQSSRAEQRDMRLAIEDLAHDVRIGLVGEERWRAEIARMSESLQHEIHQSHIERRLMRNDLENFRKLGNLFNHMLEDKATTWIEQGSYSNRALQDRNLYNKNPAPEPMLSFQSSSLYTWTSDEVMLNSVKLEDFIYRDRIRLDDGRSRPTSAAPTALRRISEWMNSATSRTLWIDGPSVSLADFDNPLSSLASSVVELAEKAHVPVVSYFCNLRRGETLQAGNDTREIQACLALTFALVRQLLELLEPQFETKVDLSEPRFSLLDGCILSWPEIIRLFRDLLSLMPDTLLCVIDGLHWLDDRSTHCYLDELVSAMQSSKMRVLFTTTGRAACLRKQLTTRDTFVVEATDLRGNVWGASKGNLRMNNSGQDGRKCRRKDTRFYEDNEKRQHVIYRLK
ncbi:hypothetical protein GGR57DRAFT_508995 [Xylariaceae sp. FL1272]|nr:hypothetical protein GGR57DRAFT_508995 [Xylariaceae sp. FL1272]